MKSHITKDFKSCFKSLPGHIKRSAHRCYQTWRADPNHPSLQFKPVGKRPPVYSIRVALGWRAMGIVEGNSIIWFWIGSHADYDLLLKKHR
ncbi:MAG: ParE family toxin-like protein [Planctomycetota bacterium]